MGIENAFDMGTRATYAEINRKRKAIATLQRQDCMMSWEMPAVNLSPVFDAYAARLDEVERVNAVFRAVKKPVRYVAYRLDKPTHGARIFEAAKELGFDEGGVLWAVGQRGLYDDSIKRYDEHRRDAHSPVIEYFRLENKGGKLTVCGVTMYERDLRAKVWASIAEKQFAHLREAGALERDDHHDKIVVNAISEQAARSCMGIEVKCAPVMLYNCNKARQYDDEIRQALSIETFAKQLNAASAASAASEASEDCKA